MRPEPAEKPEPQATSPKPASNRREERRHAEDLIDEALEETFPASDPISPAQPRSH